MMTGTSNMNLVIDAIQLKQCTGIPTYFVNIMQHDIIERIAGVSPGSYIKDPENVYVKMQQNMGVGLLDQYIPTNPLHIGQHGYEHGSFNATTGANIVCDGMIIDTPEAVIDHLEKYELPGLLQRAANFNEDERVSEILDQESTIQGKLGPDVVKAGYEFIKFPIMDYYKYGYSNYFMAFALYPEVIEQHFKLQADYALLNNKAALRAYKEVQLPPLFRLDHDMADSRGTLVNIRQLDRMWFPYFIRSLDPLLKSDIRMIWHCDGNLMQMVPRLLDVGIKGFQGFQYEDGMEYEKICKMKTRDGDDLIIFAGVSVTRTLPLGTSKDVKREMQWLVENGPKAGLFLSASSSVAPGVPWENINTMIEGFRYYRENGRE